MEHTHRRTSWIELSRIIGAFAIIMFHVSLSYVVLKCYFGTDTFIYANMWYTLMRFGVGSFVMLSGALFLNPDKNVTIKNIITKYVYRLLVVYVFWYFIYKLFYNGIGHKDLWHDFIEFEPADHLWFIPMLAGLYLFTPIIKKVADDKKIVGYWIVLCLLFCYIPKLFELAPGLYNKYQSARSFVMVTDYTAGYLAYYLTGHYIYYYGVKDKTKRLLYVAGCCSAIYGMVFSYVYAQRNHGFNKLTTQNQSLNTFLFVTAVFLFFINVLGRVNFSERSKKWIGVGGGCTLGIYAIHPMFIMLFKKSGVLKELSGQALFTIPLVSLLIFVLSFGVIVIMKRIPVVKKWFV